MAGDHYDAQLRDLCAPIRHTYISLVDGSKRQKHQPHNIVARSHRGSLKPYVDSRADIHLWFPSNRHHHIRGNRHTVSAFLKRLLYKLSKMFPFAFASKIQNRTTEFFIGGKALIGVVSEVLWRHLEPVANDIYQTLAGVYSGEIGDPSVRISISTDDACPVLLSLVGFLRLQPKSILPFGHIIKKLLHIFLRQ